MALSDHGIEAKDDWATILDGVIPGKSHATVKATKEDVNNSAALQDDDELLFPMEANATYAFEFFLRAGVDGGPGAGVKVAINGPAAPGTIQMWVMFSDDNGVGVDVAVGGFAGAYETAEARAITGGQYCAIILRGTVANGANAGNLILRWAQDAAVENDTYVDAGSYVVWHKA